MEAASASLASIPLYRLAPRRLRLGPFASGRDLVKFLGIATIGALVAAVSSAMAWLPFLALGVAVSFVRVDAQTLDDYALGYCRYRWRSSPRSRTLSGPEAPTRRTSAAYREPPGSVRAGGIPIAYLPPAELERLFEDWRSALGTLDRPLFCRVLGERFSPLPFLPAVSPPPGPERAALDSYREMIRLLLRHRYRRRVDLLVADRDRPAEPGAPLPRNPFDGLVDSLGRMGVPARTAPSTPPAPESFEGERH